MTQLDALTQKGISKLILDLRDNGGGWKRQIELPMSF